MQSSSEVILRYFLSWVSLMNQWDLSLEGDRGTGRGTEARQVLAELAVLEQRSVKLLSFLVCSWRTSGIRGSSVCLPRQMESTEAYRRSHRVSSGSGMPGLEHVPSSLLTCVFLMDFKTLRFEQRALFWNGFVFAAGEALNKITLYVLDNKGYSSVQNLYSFLCMCVLNSKSL